MNETCKSLEQTKQNHLSNEIILTATLALHYISGSRQQNAAFYRAQMQR